VEPIVSDRPDQEPAASADCYLSTTEEHVMANERNPNDSNLASYPTRPIGKGDDIRDRSRLDEDLQVDPILADGPASSGRIAVYAVAIAVVLGGVLYGLDHSSLKHAGTSTAQNAAPSSPPATPASRPNTEPGTTTGAAPAHPATAPSSAPTGADVNRSGNPAANNTTPVENPPPAK
jgi:hypothetical protein